METWAVLPKEQLDKVYQATVQATEEAIINALVAAKTMKGTNDNTIYAIPHKKMMDAINNYSHLTGK
ncbi:Peptidase family S58 [compost metagenome]